MFDVGRSLVSHLILLDARGQRRCSYETAQYFKSEPQNIEQEISNDEVWNRFAQTISD